MLPLGVLSGANLPMWKQYQHRDGINNDSRVKALGLHQKGKSNVGQYALLVNLDKKQYLYSHSVGDGLKFMEFGTSACGLMTALTLLLADGNGRGSGDFATKRDIVGSWAGDRVVAAGDYADPGKYLTPENITAYHEAAAKEEGADASGKKPDEPNLYAVASLTFEDVTFRVAEAMCDDPYLREQLVERTAYQTDPARQAPCLVKAHAIAKRVKDLKDVGFIRAKDGLGETQGEEDKAKKRMKDMLSAFKSGKVEVKEAMTGWTDGAEAEPTAEAWCQQWATDAYLLMTARGVDKKAMCAALSSGPDGDVFKAEMAAAALRAEVQPEA